MRWWAGRAAAAAVASGGGSDGHTSAQDRQSHGSTGYSSACSSACIVRRARRGEVHALREGLDCKLTEGVDVRWMRFELKSNTRCVRLQIARASCELGASWSTGAHPEEDEESSWPSNQPFELNVI